MKEEREEEEGKKRMGMLPFEEEMARIASLVDREKLDKWDPEARPLYSRGHAEELGSANTVHWEFRMSYLFGTLVERLWDGDPDIDALSDKKWKGRLLTQAERVVARLWLVENLSVLETAYILRRRESWVLRMTDRVLDKLMTYLMKI